MQACSFSFATVHFTLLIMLVSEYRSSDEIELSSPISESFDVKAKTEVEGLSEDETEDEEANQPFAWQSRRVTWPTFNIYTAALGLLWIVSLLSVFGLGRLSRSSARIELVDGPSQTNTTIAKVSMLYGEQKEHYVRAIASHQRHADRWGYPFHVSREDGGCGFWNKPSYLLTMLAKEFAKPQPERREWLMWVDADTIVLNPHIPAEVFLPPSGPKFSHISFVGTRDSGGLNSGVFFLRVSEWSVEMIVASMELQLCRPKFDLGRNKDQYAMALTFNKSTGGPSGRGYKEGVAYVPRHWFNSYDHPLGSGNRTGTRTYDFPGSKLGHSYGGVVGDFIVHFPGLNTGRPELMMDWEDLVESERAGEWAHPLEETNYPEMTESFWEQYKTALDLLDESESIRRGGPALVESARLLRASLQEQSDDMAVMSSRMDEVRKHLRKTKEGDST